MTDAKSATNLSRSELLDCFRTMTLIRKVEEQLGDDFKRGDLPGPVHLYIGQEAVAVGVCAHLSDDDWIASTHRGHGHFLAKGGDPKAMIAEVYGRATGICGGKGGSMHVADFTKGILGANGIVGGGIALTMGAALSAQLDGSGSVGVAFFGDGAANQGVMTEALNVAALWRLPIIMVCENNGFSEFSPTATVTSGSIAARAEPYGVPSQAIDGNDLLAVWQATNAAVRRARAGEGPSFIEAQTYRIRGHVEAEGSILAQPYREDAEIETWRQKDPIRRLATYLVEQEIAETGELSDIEAAVTATVAEAVAYAHEQPEPEPEMAFKHMFA